jgi:hypothetical protein
MNKSSLWKIYLKRIVNQYNYLVYVEIWLHCSTNQIEGHFFYFHISY